MASIDFSSVLPGYIRHPSAAPGTIKARYFLMASFAASAALIALALNMYGQTVKGWDVAALSTLRLSFFLFLLAFIAAPLSRLVPQLRLYLTPSDSHKLILTFAMAYAASLAATIAPYYLPFAEPLVRMMPATTIMYVAAGVVMLIAMLAGALSGSDRVMGTRTLLRLQTMVLVYFWSLFALAAFDHLVGPRRPDAFFGLSLVLLIAGILIRFADDFLHRRASISPHA